jgi:hypothetical protein
MASLSHYGEALTIEFWRVISGATATLASNAPPLSD